MGCGSSNEDRVKVNNPLIIHICIGNYEEKDEVGNLLTAHADFDAMKQFCNTQNYKLSPSENKVLWNEQELISFLRMKAFSAMILAFLFIDKQK